MKSKLEISDIKKDRKLNCIHLLCLSELYPLLRLTVRTSRDGIGVDPPLALNAASIHLSAEPYSSLNVVLLIENMDMCSHKWLFTFSFKMSSFLLLKF